MEGTLEGKKIFVHHCWYVVYTRARHEKVVYYKLNERGIESFPPIGDTTSGARLFIVMILFCQVFVGR